MKKCQRRAPDKIATWCAVLFGTLAVESTATVDNHYNHLPFWRGDDWSEYTRFVALFVVTFTK